MRDALAVKIHCPIAPATLVALLAGDVTALDADPAASALMSLLRAGSPLGDFGLYHGVVEIAPGWEHFTPAAGASPTLGKADTASLSSTVILTTYAPAGADIDGALAALMAAHPWEVPVIEVQQTRLLVRG
jgi:hypothetical protein